MCSGAFMSGKHVIFQHIYLNLSSKPAIDNPPFIEDFHGTGSQGQHGWPLPGMPHDAYVS